MTTQEYLNDVLSTEARDWNPLQERFSTVKNIRTLHGVIGMASELGELQTVLDKAYYNDYEVDAVNLKEEIGDMYWYMGVLTAALGLDVDRVLGGPSHHEGDVASNKHFSWEQVQSCVEVIVVNTSEAVDYVKKSVMYGKELNLENFTKSLANVNAAMRDALSYYGLTGEDAQYANSQKLLRGKEARYKNGFSEQAALNRNLEAERAILETKE